MELFYSLDDRLMVHDLKK